MTRRIDNRGRYWLPVGLAFLLGLFIGWWIIGWWLWPVTYSNALPPDLRSEEKGQYLGMVADSYATTGDLPTAQNRTSSWTKDQLARDLSTLQSRVAQDNPAQADHVQRLATALNAAGPANAQPAAPPAQAEPGLLQRLCTAGLWLLLALVGIAALVWLYRQWRQRASRPPAPAPVPTGPAHATPAPWPAGSATDVADQEEMHWDETPLSAQAPAPAGAGTMWQPVETRAASPAEAAVATRSPEPGASAEPAAAPKLTKVGEFMAAYHAGEPDYDEGFDIKDTSGAVVAMCGLGLMSPVGRGNDQAAALQVWLWEKSDQFTQVQVLMSENAYKDTGAREQLAEDYPALPIRQGTEFDMQTHGFLLHGIVERIIYEEGEEVNRIFQHLAVRMRVSQKDRA